MEFELDINHYIQRDIFSKLVFTESAHFSELKPEKVESNLFMYHLNQLIKQGFVEKREKNYTLAPKGRWFADQISLKTLRYRVQPKLIIILAVHDPSNNLWLMMERVHQPHNGALGFPSGKLHYGETFSEAALRELEEKAAIVKTPLAYRGHITMRLGEGEFMRQVIGAIYYGEYSHTEQKPVRSSSGLAYWAEPRDLEQASFIPGYWEIREQLDKGMGNFFLELDFPV